MDNNTMNNISQGSVRTHDKKIKRN